MAKHPTRRQVLAAGASAIAGVLLPARLFAQPAAAAAATAALADSPLIYITPLHRDGRESTCQSEVWFVPDGTNVYVVTAHDAWRARALEKGLKRAHVWVGDVGVWKRSDGAYRKLPGMEVQGELIDDKATHQRVLDLYGDKYSLEWVMWGPRFRSGLADGSRVMLHYTPA